MDLRGLGSSGPSALICWGRYGSYMPVAGFVLRTSSRLAVDAGRLSVRAIPRTLMPAFRQSAMLMRSSWLRYLELIFWGMSTVERYQSTDGFSFLPFDRVLPLRHTLPVRLDTPTARAACVKFMPASRCSTYRRRRAAHISPRVAYSTPSNTHLSTWPSHQSARRCDDHWNPPTLHPRYLSQEERIQIADRLRLGDSIRAIARLLGRDPGTVSREVERNRNPESGGYEPYRAQQKAADRLKRPKPRKAAEGTRLWDEIAAGLRRHWSPEQIANRLRLDFPDNGDMHASVETIYQAIYLQARGELKQELKRAMRQGRTARRPQGGQGRKPRFREPMAMISERPPEIEDRAVPGHWEGDLITGSRNKSAIGTLVERTTRFTILLHLPDGHDAEHVQQAIIDKMQHLPKLLRNSLTWDQGAELALHKRIGASLDMAVYFCDPHSPWQRGTNENTNGLLRQYFPKGTDLSVYPEDYLDAVAEELNDRPRKTLGFMKPSEKIIELLDAA